MNWIWLNSIEYKMVEFNSNWIHSNQFDFNSNQIKFNQVMKRCIFIFKNIYLCKWVDEKSEIVKIVMECFPNCEMNNIQIVMGTIETRVLALELWTPVPRITSSFGKSEIYCRNWHTTLVGQEPLVTSPTIHKGNIGKASSNIRRSTINLTLRCRRNYFL
jgi:hypothetical protein